MSDLCQKCNGPLVTVCYCYIAPDIYTCHLHCERCDGKVENDFRTRVVGRIEGVAGTSDGDGGEGSG
jgi:hypothetical protein